VGGCRHINNEPFLQESALKTLREAVAESSSTKGHVSLRRAFEREGSNHSDRLGGLGGETLQHSNQAALDVLACLTTANLSHVPCSFVLFWSPF
jgi:hypothetical protein